jgi:hypothetical protein
MKNTIRLYVPVIFTLCNGNYAEINQFPVKMRIINFFYQHQVVCPHKSLKLKWLLHMAIRLLLLRCNRAIAFAQQKHVREIGDIL